MSSQPISIGSARSSIDLASISRRSSTSSTQYSTCAYPSWPSGHGLKREPSGVPSAYLSDEDLFGDDEDEPYLSEPPPPPRSAAMWAPPVMLARPLLPPVTKPRRRSSSDKKERKSSKASVSSKS